MTSAYKELIMKLGNIPHDKEMNFLWKGPQILNEFAPFWYVSQCFSAYSMI